MHIFIKKFPSFFFFLFYSLVLFFFFYPSNSLPCLPSEEVDLFLPKYFLSSPLSGFEGGVRYDLDGLDHTGEVGSGCSGGWGSGSIKRGEEEMREKGGDLV